MLLVVTNGFFYLHLERNNKIECPNEEVLEVKGVITIKKIIIGFLVISLFFISVLIYNHQQQPTVEAVFETTKNWSPTTEEVYLLRKIDGEWLTIFRNQHAILVGELKQNWFGIWQIRDEMGAESSISSTYYPPEENDEITWNTGGVGEKEIVYYFGQIINPKIQQITVFDEDVPIITSNGYRFFFKKLKGDFVMPTNIKAYSKSGELIHSTVSDTP